MNPYESPISAPEKVPLKLPWTRLLLLALGLLVAAALITPALMPAKQSGSYRSIPIDEEATTIKAEPMEPTQIP